MLSFISGALIGLGVCLIGYPVWDGKKFSFRNLCILIAAILVCDSIGYLINSLIKG